MRRASLSVSSSSASSVTMRLIMPSSSASRAVKGSPVHISSLALLRLLKSHGSTRISSEEADMRRVGLVKTAFSAATIKSHMQATIMPPATACPCTCATVGLKRFLMFRHFSRYISCS